MWKIHHLTFYLLFYFSVSYVKINALSLRTSLICLCIPSAKCWGLLADIVSREQVLSSSLKWPCRQLPHQGRRTYIHGLHRSLKPAGRQQLPCPHTSPFFLNPRASLALPAPPARVPSMHPPSPLPVGAGWAFPDAASVYDRGREFWSSLGSSVLWLQRHSWFIGQKMKTTDTTAYKLAGPLGGKERVEENVPWDCSLRAAVASGLWHSMPSHENQRPSGRKKEGTERQLATYGEHLGLLPKGIFIWEHLGPAP